MRCQVIALLLLSFCPLSSAAVTGNGESDSAISKVVKLLQEMLDDSKADGVTDRDLFAKYKCYCDSNEADKKKSVEEMTKQIALLEAEIDDLRASSGRLSTQSGILDKKMSDNEASRNAATEVRDKANADFISEEDDMKAAVDQMDSAIETLAAIGADQTAKDSALITKQETFLSKQTKLDGAQGKVERALKAASIFLTGTQQKTVTNFLQSDAPFTGEYSAQSGEIVGILKSMRDTFKTNLKNSRAEEKKAADAHGRYDGVMNDAFTEAKESFDAKQELLGSNDDSLATAQESLETAQTTKAEDSDFLTSLIPMCAEKQKEYEERKMVRSNEEAAVAQAISILNSDAAVGSFDKIDATSFLQVSKNEKTSKKVRQSVKSLLQKQAQKHKSMRLAKLAVAMESNPFSVVIKAIKKQMLVIDKEEKADDDEKAFCDDDRAKNDEMLETKVQNIDRLAGEVDNLTDELDNPDTGLKAVLAETQNSLKDNKASQATETEQRQLDNALYQKEIGNLIAAEKLIEKATKTLAKFYNWLKRRNGPHHYDAHEGKDSGGSQIQRIKDADVDELEAACSAEPKCSGFNTQGWLKSSIQDENEWIDLEGNTLYVKVYDDSFVQRSARAVRVQKAGSKKEDPAPPDAEFEGNQDSKGGDAIGMLETILEDTKAEEKTVHETEEGSQAAYEEEMTRLKEEENTFLETIATTEQGVADKEKLKEEKIMNHGETEKDKKAIERYLVAIKPGCDFINDNLDQRKQTRVDEKESLQTAIDEMEATPEYEQAKARDEAEALGDCADPCLDNGMDHVSCRACTGKTTPSGFCASNPDTPGCDEVLAHSNDF